MDPRDAGAGGGGGTVGNNGIFSREGSCEWFKHNLEVLWVKLENECKVTFVVNTP